VARTAGSRNANYDEQRLSLARKVRPLVMLPGGVNVSLRDMAQGAEVAVATLKHYFIDREGVLAAVLESQRIDAAPYLALASIPPPGKSSVRHSLLTLLQRLKSAWFQHGVGQIHAASLAMGLSVTRLGPTYLSSILEPMLQMAEGYLRRHVELGELPPLNERLAALELLGPVLLGLLHQDSLSGTSCRPLEVDRFLKEHLESFLRSHLPAKKKAAPRLAPPSPRRRSPRRRSPRKASPG
jgi:AcrR family transcriptional regulator